MSQPALSRDMIIGIGGGAREYAPEGVISAPTATLQNEVRRVLKRSRPGSGRHRATNYELVLHRS